MTFIRRFYLIFILFPVAITYAVITMLWVLLTHLFEISILKPKNK